MLSFFPRGVLDEILNLINSVSEGFPSFSFAIIINHVIVREMNHKKAFRKCKQMASRSKVGYHSNTYYPCFKFEDVAASRSGTFM